MSVSLITVSPDLYHLPHLIPGPTRLDQNNAHPPLHSFTSIVDPSIHMKRTMIFDVSRDGHPNAVVGRLGRRCIRVRRSAHRTWTLEERGSVAAVGASWASVRVPLAPTGSLESARGVRV